MIIMQLFNIAGVDLTKHITVPSYEVNQEDEYKKWTDANYIEHRECFRKRISGKFTMKFLDKARYFEFLELLETNREVGGYTPASLYVNNLNKVVATNVFISIAPANTLPFFRNESYKGFTVTVKER